MNQLVIHGNNQHFDLEFLRSFYNTFTNETKEEIDRYSYEFLKKFHLKNKQEVTKYSQVNQGYRSYQQPINIPVIDCHHDPCLEHIIKLLTNKGDKDCNCKFRHDHSKDIELKKQYRDINCVEALNLYQESIKKNLLMKRKIIFKSEDNTISEDKDCSHGINCINLLIKGYCKYKHYETDDEIDEKRQTTKLVDLLNYKKNYCYHKDDCYYYIRNGFCNSRHRPEEIDIMDGHRIKGLMANQGFMNECLLRNKKNKQEN
jgi:hypothetical protein